MESNNSYIVWWAFVSTKRGQKESDIAYDTWPQEAFFVWAEQK